MGSRRYGAATTSGWPNCLRIAACSSSLSGRPSSAAFSSICESMLSPNSFTTSSRRLLSIYSLTACKYLSRSSMGLCLLQNSVERCVDGLPLFQQLFQDQLALLREPVKTLVAFVLFAPLAGEQPLGFQPAQQRIERAFINGQPLVVQGLA